MKSNFHLTKILSQKFLACLAFCCLISSQASADIVIDFEDLPLDPDSFYNGADNAGGFTSQGTFFNNSFTDFGDFTIWDGWSLSNQTDITTPGFGNQFSAYHLPDGGGDNSQNFAVSFGSPGSFINLPAEMQIQSLRVTNTTYVALDMKSGSAFSKKFGGLSGNDPDFFKLTIIGHQGGETGSVVGTVDFFLADFSPTDNSQDYIIDQWTTVDLTSLSGADTLTFALESSDTGAFGMNTPAYIAIDNLTLSAVPEPSSVITMLTGIFLLALARGFGRSRRTMQSDCC